jgi:SPP1 family predicted phage head-tail adaptor
MNIGSLDRRVTIEYPVAGQDAQFGTPVITWTLLAVVWAEVQDVMPSRSEAVKQGLITAHNQTRVRYRYRTDVTSEMRMTVAGPPDRVLQIIAGPAAIGKRGTLSEVVCESVSS